MPKMKFLPAVVMLGATPIAAQAPNNNAHHARSTMIDWPIS
jgi:hypothetical protein